MLINECLQSNSATGFVYIVSPSYLLCYNNIRKYYYNKVKFRGMYVHLIRLVLNVYKSSKINTWPHSSQQQ